MSHCISLVLVGCRYNTSNDKNDDNNNNNNDNNDNGNNNNAMIGPSFLGKFCPSQPSGTRQMAEIYRHQVVL